MSAICGIFHFDGRPVAPDALASAMSRLHPYGPDDGGTWQDGPLAFGNRTLHTTPECRHAAMPLRHGPVVLTADIRLDNREDLFHLLGIPGPEQAGMADSVLLLAAYARWGEACLDHIVGDFAFALWDDSRRTLFCARDAMGMKPFYYHAGTDFIAFASEPMALLDLPGVPWGLDEIAVADQLVLNSGANPDATFFTGARRLLPAHHLTATAAGVRIRRYWKADLSREVRFSRDEEYVEAYLEHLRRAVHDRLRSDHPVASFLSGGIDSSIITCLAARRLKEEGRPPLLTASIVLEDDDINPVADERPLIDAVLATQDHLSPGFFTYAGKSLATELLRGRPGKDMPPETEIVSEIAAYVRAGGANVLLGGYGGDQCATSRGNGALIDLGHTHRWGAFWRLAQDMAARRGRSPLRVTLDALTDIYLPTLRETVAQRLNKREAKPWQRHLEEIAVAAPDLVRRLRLEERLASGIRFKRPRFRRLREHQWSLLTDWDLHGLQEGMVRSLAPAGIDFRQPMFDRRLIEYCLAVPPEQHAAGLGRHLVRRAAVGLLPDAVRLLATKRAGGVRPSPARFALRDINTLRALLNELEQVPLVQSFIDTEKVRQRLAIDYPAAFQPGDRRVGILGSAASACMLANFLRWFDQETKARAHVRSAS